MKRPGKLGKKLGKAERELIAAASAAIARRYRNDWQEVGAAFAVRHPSPGEKDQTIAVVSPCGACRELIFDYDPGARVIVPKGKSPAVVSIAELLPNKYSRGSEG